MHTRNRWIAVAFAAAAVAAPAAQATGPDDRAGVRGIGVQPMSPQQVLDVVKRTSPNQVGLAWQYLRDTGQLATPSAPPRADDRAGVRGIEPATVTPSIGRPSAFEWGDAGVGAAGAFGLMLLASGVLIVSRHSNRARRDPNAEAAAGT